MKKGISKRVYKTVEEGKKHYARLAWNQTSFLTDKEIEELKKETAEWKNDANQESNKPF